MGSFSVIHWVITIGIVYMIYSFIKNTVDRQKSGGSSDGPMVCKNCGTRGKAKIITKGSIAIEIVLWLCLLIPGLIYSIWRLTTKQQCCPSCKQPGMIGVNTPFGKKIIENKL